MPMIALLELLIGLLGEVRAYQLCNLIMVSAPGANLWIQALLDPLPGASPMSFGTRVIKSGAAGLVGKDVASFKNVPAGQSVAGDVLQQVVMATRSVYPETVGRISLQQWREIVRGLRSPGMTSTQFNALFGRAVYNRPLRNFVDAPGLQAELVRRGGGSVVRQLWLGPEVGQLLESRRWMLFEFGSEWFVWSTIRQKRIPVPPMVNNAASFRQWVWSTNLI